MLPRPVSTAPTAPDLPCPSFPVWPAPTAAASGARGSSTRRGEREKEIDVTMKQDKIHVFMKKPFTSSSMHIEMDEQPTDFDFCGCPIYPASSAVKNQQSFGESLRCCCSLDCALHSAWHENDVGVVVVRSACTPTPYGGRGLWADDLESGFLHVIMSGRVVLVGVQTEQKRIEAGGRGQ